MLQWSIEGLSPEAAILAIAVYFVFRIGEWGLKVVYERRKEPASAADRSLDIDTEQFDRIESEVRAVHGVVLHKTADGNLRIYGDPVLKHEVEQTRNLVASCVDRLKDLDAQLDSVKDTLLRHDEQAKNRFDANDDKIKEVSDRLRDHDNWERHAKHGPQRT